MLPSISYKYTQRGKANKNLDETIVRPVNNKRRVNI